MSSQQASKNTRTETIRRMGQMMHLCKITAVAGILFAAGCTVAPPPANPGMSEVLYRGAHSGERAEIYYSMSLTPKCESMGNPDIRVVSYPRHGSVSIEHGEHYPNFGKDNVRAACNANLAPGVLVFYQSSQDFHGKDSFSVKVLSPDNAIKTVRIDMDVL
jgi:hypothetical protein